MALTQLPRLGSNPCGVMSIVGKEDMIESLAVIVREVLTEDRPQHPNLEEQCKRATMLLDLFLRALDVDSIPQAGWIVPPGQEPCWELGHVWLELDGSYILDVTLTQFRQLLGCDVPDIVCGDVGVIGDRYHYRNDGLDTWEYNGYAVAALIPVVRERLLVTYPNLLLPGIVIPGWY